MRTVPVIGFSDSYFSETARVAWIHTVDVERHAKMAGHFSILHREPCHKTILTNAKLPEQGLDDLSSRRRRH